MIRCKNLARNISLSVTLSEESQTKFDDMVTPIVLQYKI